MKTPKYRSLPSIDSILNDRRMVDLRKTYSHNSIVSLLRSEMELFRIAIRSDAEVKDVDSIVNNIVKRVSRTWSNSPARVVNATGVVLHTNLGRSPLSDEAVAAAMAATSGYTDLEFNLNTGGRGSRQTHISQILSDVTAAEAGFVVNNNASAVLLVLSALAEGEEVIVSRGEAVEIGGGFRVPDVMDQSGARLIEVGTTNRTYAKDYQNAVTPKTKALLKVHPSNFSVSGFTHNPKITELVEVGNKMKIPVLNDLGSGAMIDTERFGLRHEPTVGESVRAGVDLTMFSGDKLLGGPQSGIIVGKRSLIDTVSTHPLTRAVRVDKITLASLNATLLVYLKGSEETDIPIWRMISCKPDDIKHRAENWCQTVRKGEVIDGFSTIGGGSLPGQTMPTFVLKIDGLIKADEFLTKLRLHNPPVVGRIHDDTVLLDPRTVLPDEDEHILSALLDALDG